MMYSKWRKGLGFLLAAFLVVFLIAGSDVYGTDNRELHSYVSVNDYATIAANDGDKQVLASSTALTIQYHRIIGYVVVPCDVAYPSELTIGLYDGTTAADFTEAKVFDEAEWDDDGNNQPRWYKHPKRLTEGLCFIQGANTVAIIYYEDTREF